MFSASSSQLKQCRSLLLLYAVMPIKPLEFKLNRDDVTLSLHGSGATIVSEFLQLLGVWQSMWWKNLNF